MKNEEWSMKYEVWSMKWSMKYEIKYEVCSMKYEMKYEVWSMKYKVWSMKDKYEVWSMKVLKNQGKLRIKYNEGWGIKIEGSRLDERWKIKEVGWGFKVKGPS